MAVLFFLSGALAGAAVCFLVMRERVAGLARLASELPALRLENAALKQTSGELKGRLETLEQAKDEMASAFAAASSAALRENSGEFLKLADERFRRLQGDAASDWTLRQRAVTELVEPLKSSLGRVEEQITRAEQERIRGYAALTTQVTALEAEARKLSSALASPTARGRWGEVQLRRIVELAGMLGYCDFQEQASINGGEGRLRPDLLIQLPNGRQIVVDSKVPLTAYLAACEAKSDETRRDKMLEHSRQIRGHMKTLGSKAYSAQLNASPEFVVAFLPGEIFFSAALEADPELLEYGVQNNVILATPTTLIALLKAVAYGWKQEQVARSAQEIRQLGAQLYDRVAKFTEDFESVGKSLRTAMKVWDQGRVSLESRLVVTARKFEELGVGSAATRALPEPLPFAGELSLGFEDEGWSNPGKARKAAADGAHPA